MSAEVRLRENRGGDVSNLVRRSVHKRIISYLQDLDLNIDPFTFPEPSETEVTREISDLCSSSESVHSDWSLYSDGSEACIRIPRSTPHTRHRSVSPRQRATKPGQTWALKRSVSRAASCESTVSADSKEFYMNFRERPSACSKLFGPGPGSSSESVWSYRSNDQPPEF